jgi:hypothetical protein
MPPGTSVVPYTGRTFLGTILGNKFLKNTTRIGNGNKEQQRKTRILRNTDLRICKDRHIVGKCKWLK